MTYRENGEYAANNRALEPFLKTVRAELANGEPGVMVTNGKYKMVLTRNAAFKLAWSIANNLTNINKKEKS